VTCTSPRDPKNKLARKSQKKTKKKKKNHFLYCGSFSL
jgi:hypothetical protein